MEGYKSIEWAGLAQAKIRLEPFKGDVVLPGDNWEIDFLQLFLTRLNLFIFLILLYIFM